MPARFARLRITGFKSFADATTLDLPPGLTGIVGPNGCGKSNVVEALRWAMGEASAKSLRGGDMDDVIFSGTAHRPRRDLAEVTIWLEDTLGLAPAPLHGEPELEISRRITRGDGSVYRVNGRELRARDIQTLFADLATGARASAMVSQGRVAAVVSASPAERRMILEEAAGITGLHARRHEAELKLRAAETNLARADDLKVQLAGRLDDLRRQARQAARFRGIGDMVRVAEAELLAIQLAAVQAEVDEAAARLSTAQAETTQAVAAATAASAAAMSAEAALPALRRSESDARTVLERARLAGEQAAAALAETEQTRRVAGERAAQVKRDLDHARTLAQDAAGSLQRLDAEAAQLDRDAAELPNSLEQANAALAAAEAHLALTESAAHDANERAAELLARHRAAQESESAARARAERARAEASRLQAALTISEADLVSPDRLTEAQVDAAASDATRQQADAALETAEVAHQAAQSRLAAARAAETKAAAARSRLDAAAQGVAEALAASARQSAAGVIDRLDVPAGLETALAAALGEDAQSGLDPAEARFWRELPTLSPPPLPDGVTALDALIGGPTPLRRALAWSGLVEGDGALLQPLLQPGQVLVDRAGAAWRWDGHTTRAGAPRAAAVRLQQRNRLAALRAELADAEAQHNGATAAAQEASAAEREASKVLLAARDAARATARHAEARARAAAELASRQAAAQARVAALGEQTSRAHAEHEAASEALRQATAALSALDDPAAARGAQSEARAALAAGRQQASAARERRDTLQRTLAARLKRRDSLHAERQDWLMRAEDAAGRVTDLLARAAEADAMLRAAEAAPARAAQHHAASLDALQKAETAHREHATALAAAEQAMQAAARDARAAESRVIAARETVLRAEAGAAQAEQSRRAIRERILERLGPEAALPDPGSGEQAEERARRRLERLQRERAEMGPVNLRAEIEATETAEQVETITREAAELHTAIAKLRGSIGHINREGRERVAQIFADIDRHFRALFERMFGGGRAHLALVGSDDPLQAGLEIFAQPPGKKLSSLSLLSGGEQALAALSLIFAVFRCQPAPICVLDEVDAPLDDANVGRFCALLDDMARETGTRFLVVTHHQLTMARMDRLYGVTMQERGVSRLLSVDFQRAAAMIEPQRIAAE